MPSISVMMWVAFQGALVESALLQWWDVTD